MRLIDADKFEAFASRIPANDNPDYNTGYIHGMERVLDEIDAAPTVDVAPHAEWKINADGYYPYCSACKKEPPGRCMTAHCPNCGAVVRGPFGESVNCPSCGKRVKAPAR